MNPTIKATNAPLKFFRASLGVACCSVVCLLRHLWTSAELSLNHLDISPASLIRIVLKDAVHRNILSSFKIRHCCIPFVDGVNVRTFLRCGPGKSQVKKIVFAQLEITFSSVSKIFQHGNKKGSILALQ